MPEYEIAKRLEIWGLTPYEVELIMARYVEGKPMAEICTEQGWISMNSAYYFLKQTLKKLRNGKFSL